MKKTKLFSRIFAAALAAMIAATTLVTNTGAGLLAFANEEGGTGTDEGGGDNTTPTPSTEKYSVKIISPDVPADGKTYAYNFYRIIDGEVEEDNGKNVLGNPKWGAALGGTAFDNVPDGKTPVGSNYYQVDNMTVNNIGVGYYPSSEVMLAALSGTMSCDPYDMDTSGSPPHGLLIKSAYKEYCKILHSYGVPFQVEELMKGENNYFFDQFNRGLKKNGETETWNKSNKSRDAVGLVQLLNAGSTSGALKTADLRAFADLLLNGVTVTIDLGDIEVEVTDEKGNTTKTTTPNYHYNFITGTPQYTQMVESGGTYIVTDYKKDAAGNYEKDEKGEKIEIGLEPGYYLVACVDVKYEYEKNADGSTKYDNDGKPVIAVDGNGKPIILNTPLTNDGYETSMPIKPVSTMLILVGPANNGVAEIVGKNAYTVPTVTLEMYQKPVQLDLGDNPIGTSLNGNYSSSTGYEHDVKGIDTIIEEDNWKNTGSFDYYDAAAAAAADRKEAILYRIGITLPLNFDQYKDHGYFLAVLDQYSHFSAAANPAIEIERVVNVRPYVYVKHSENGTDTYTPVGRCRGNTGDAVNITATVGSAIIETTNSGIDVKLSGTSNNHTYDQNKELGFYANDLFCFGNLYDYTTGAGEDKKCVFKPGDTIYIYYPAILSKTNVYTNEKYLLNANRVWAVYSNNPYADELDYAAGNSCNHIKNGEVGITPIAEANVNTYGVTLKVTGEEVGEKKYNSGAKFALYREVKGDKGETTKEYAYTNWDASYHYGHVVRWIPASELQVELDTELENETPKFKTIEGALLNYSKNSNANTAYLTTAITGIDGTHGIKIKGLAAGEYFLQELTISSNGMSGGSEIDNPKHENIENYHYKLAEKPIIFNIGNEYNQSVNGYLGKDDNQKTFISELTVDFFQEDPERTIETRIYKPLERKLEKVYDQTKWGEEATADGEDDQDPAEAGKETPAIKSYKWMIVSKKYVDNHVVTKYEDLSYSKKEGEKETSVFVGTTYATEDGQIEIQVYHKTLNLIWLPETGGIGTTIFFIVGGTIVVAATVLIVTRFRVKRERL